MSCWNSVADFLCPYCSVETQLTKLYRDSAEHVESQFDIYRIQQDLHMLMTHMRFMLSKEKQRHSFQHYLVNNQNED